METFLADIWRTFQIGIGTFCILLLAFNFNPSWRRYPWDMSINKMGFRVYIPIISSIGIAVLVTIALKVLPTIGIGSTPFA